MNDNETVDDVLADMLLPRFDAITAMRANNYDEIKSLIANYRDRIEAAHKRERGDCAKLREALEKCANWGEQIDCQLGSSDETVYAFRDERCLAHNISECARAALSAPPRNCDVGTAEEQADMRKEATGER